MGTTLTLYMADVSRSSEGSRSGAVVRRLRPVTTYVTLVAAAAAAVILAGLVGNWPPTAEQLIWLIGFAVACVGAEELSFRIHRDWSTVAGTVPHLAAAALLLPEWAALAGAVGSAVYGARHRMGPSKIVLNAASVALAVEGAAHVLGVETKQHLLAGLWPGPLVGAGAIMAYYLVSMVAVAGAVALDQHRSFPELIWNRFNVGALAEIGLGVTGLSIAIMLNLAPAWGAALLLPAALVYLGMRTQVVLQRTEISLQQVLAHAPDAVILVGENGNVVLFNTAAEHMFADYARRAGCAVCGAIGRVTMSRAGWR